MAASVPQVPRRDRAAGGLVLRRAGPRSAYLRGETALVSPGRPVLREPSQDVAQAWGMAAARTIDAMHNSGFLAGGVGIAVGGIVGDGLKLNARPSVHLFGGDVAARDAWAQEVEARYDGFADDPLACDFHGVQSLGQTATAAMKHWFAMGEILALVGAKARPGTRYVTKVRLLPAMRMPIVTRFPDLVDGVYVDRDGAPEAVRLVDRDRSGFTRERRIRLRDEAGRPIAAHVFDAEPDARRGISVFAPVLKVVRQYDQIANATLTAMLLQTIFAATIKSTLPTAEVLEGLQTEIEGENGQKDSLEGFQAFVAERMGWIDDHAIDLGQHGRIAHLWPSDELQFHGAEHPSDQFDPFSSGLLREIARAIGLSYESFTGDFRKASFSSSRMGEGIVWPIAKYRRRHIAGRFYRLVYEAWLEESIAIGETAFPGGLAGFLANRSDACRSDWRGPARLTADDKKTAEAQAILLERGVVSLETVCADYGEDVAEVAAARARESRLYKGLGLDDPHARPAGGTGTLGGSPGNVDEDSEDRGARDEEAA